MSCALSADPVAVDPRWLRHLLLATAALALAGNILFACGNTTTTDFGSDEASSSISDSASSSDSGSDSGGDSGE